MAKLSLLIVDDRPENLVSMTHLLERDDLEILTAASGNEALGKMLDADLALVLLDVQMPDMNGFEVAELMKRHPQTRNLPIIFVTAINKERGHVFSGYGAGAVDYICKPVDPFVIRSKVNVFLELKRSQLARERLVEELNRANNRLQEISDRKDASFSAVSVDLLSALAGVEESCRRIGDGSSGPVTDTQNELLAQALQGCRRLVGLIGDIDPTGRDAADGGRAEGDGPDAWSLVLFRHDQKTDEDIRWLDDEIRRNARGLAGRLENVDVDGTPCSAVTLRTDRVGAMSILAQLEESLRQRRRDSRTLQYHLAEISPQHHRDQALTGLDPEFRKFVTTPVDEGSDPVFP